MDGDRLMAILRSLWDRVPETLRVLGLLAGILDLVAVPSILVMAAHRTTQMVLPWTAWGQILTTPSLAHGYGLVALALLGGALYWGYSIQRGGSGSAGRNATAFGSARWRTPRELATSLQTWRPGSARNPAGLVAGAGSPRGAVRSAWVLGRDGHNLLLGAPGAGKSQKVILPSIAVIAEQGENLVITDPKGELKQAMAGYLADQRYRIVTFDLRFPQQSVRWNPLQPISQAMTEHRWADATRMANDLANILATQGAPGGENGAFFAQSARAIGASLALLVADQAPPDARHVASMYHILTQEADQLEARILALEPTHPARQAFGPLRTGSPETRQNQMSVVAISLSLFADPNIAWLTGASDFDPLQLLAPRTAVFIVVPDDTTTYYPLAALFVTQILQTLANAAATKPQGRLGVPIHLVLDEFGNLPKIPDFDKALAVARGRGIRITLTLQALSQLEDRYGQKTAETMRNSCNTWIYLSANDTDTARVVSDKIGQTTIETTSRGANWQPGSRNWSENTNATGRALVTPDEILRWQPDHTLVLQMGQMPAKLPARWWSEWPQAHQSIPGPLVSPSTGADVAPPPLWMPTPPEADPSALAINPEAPVHFEAVPRWRAQ